MKARAVQAKAPVRLMNRPNLGTIMARIPVRTTIIVRRTMFFPYSYFSPNLRNGLLEFRKQSVFSIISIAGITYIGNDPRRPRQYKSWTLEVKLS